MSLLSTRLDPGGADFKRNAARMEQLVAELRERLALCPGGRRRGGDEASPRAR